MEDESNNFSIRTYNCELRFRRFLELENDKTRLPKMVEVESPLVQMYTSLQKLDKETLCHVVDAMCHKLKEQILQEPDQE